MKRTRDEMEKDRTREWSICRDWPFSVPPTNQLLTITKTSDEYPLYVCGKELRTRPSTTQSICYEAILKREIRLHYSNDIDLHDMMLTISLLDPSLSECLDDYTTLSRVTSLDGVCHLSCHDADHSDSLVIYLFDFDSCVECGEVIITRQ